ncbi:MAG: hypothetical protein ACJASQ_000458 [Crocinitomicaceae bacterium]|jgi:hypothetical protein
MLRLIIVFIFALFQFSSYSQWINEIHYDNTGGDLNEGFEIAGLAGTDLSCYDVVLYNGSGGTSYSTLNLSGTIPDEGCGYGAIWFDLAGIQNGGPDGIALYNTCTTTLVQFLSYEGAFTATNGVAVGVLSTDIGVSETGSTLTTESLQLTGAGSNYADYSWNAATASSHSALNPGQSIIPCGSNSITTGTVTGGPFTVDCVGTTDAGTVDFTSVGTFIGGNIYTAQLSDAAGSFASPTSIGTLASTANSGTINFTIPAGTASGAGYLIRVISDNPITTGSSSVVFTITQTGTCGPTLPAASGLIINEWSNGPTGSQEYYEFVVSGQCGDVVDIRGYILDDNNGTFTTPASYSGTASGIAPGHFRFAFAAQWASIPVGSLILIYNADDPNSDLPADDPTDANNDSLYVVPHTSALFERCLSMPAPASPDSLYTPCTYAVSPLSGWGALSLRNSGDAIQVRQPDGTYYHGVSYGGSEISGGPHNLKLFTGSGSAMSGWFSNGDFFDISNWTSGTANATNQTAGLANNALNQAWLLEMRDSLTVNCPVTILPVEITLFEGWNEPYGNKIIWETATEKNSDYFVIDRSIDGKSWIEVQTVKSIGNSETTSNYSTVDIGFEEVMNYYRLRQYDLDGTEKRHYKSVVIDNSTVSAVELTGIYNLLGQPVTFEYKGLQIHVFSDGTSKKVFH